METMFLANTKQFNGRNYHTARNGFVDYSGYLHNDKGDDLTIEQFLSKVYPDNGSEFSLLTWEQFEPLYKEWEGSKFLGPAQVISEEDYHEALNCLPPENWCRSDGFEHFRMCEYLTGTITSQYAHKDGKYICKSIDVRDKSTWITASDFETN